MNKNNNLFFLLSYVKKFNIYAKLKTALQNASKVFLAYSFFCFTIIIFEIFLYFSPSFKTVAFYVLILSFLIAILYLLFPLIAAYFRNIKDNYLSPASILGERLGIKDQLKNIINVYLSDSLSLYSSEISSAELERITSIVKKQNKNFFFLFVKKDLTRLLASFLAIAIIFSLSLTLSESFYTAAYRLYKYDKKFGKLKKYKVQIFPGDAEVLKGKDFEISGKIFGNMPKSAYLKFKNREKTDYQKIKLSLDDSLKFRYVFQNLTSSLSYYIQIDDETTDEYKATIIYPPAVVKLKIKSMPPAYSKLPEQDFIDNGNFSALIGSKIIFELESNNTLKNAEILTDNKPIALSINNKKAFGTLTLKNDLIYSFSLIDNKGNKNETSIEYKITAIADYPPNIELLSPDRDQILGSDDRLPMLIKISDDFGFSKLNLHYRLAFSKYEKPHEKFSSITLSIPQNAKEIIFPYIWNLSSLSPGENDIIEYYLIIYDNDNVNGPKSAKTSIYKIRVPSLDEIIAEIETEQQAIEKELSKTLEEMQNLKKEIEEIDKKLKRDSKEITWEEKAKLEEITKKYQELSKKAEQLSERIKETQNKLKENNLLSPETLQKYMELQKLMEEFSSEELKKIFERMNEAISKMDRRQIQEALKNFNFNEEQFRASLERTINLFKRIQIEQKVDEILKRMERIEQLQEEAKQLANQGKMEEAAKLQNQIAKELENLEKEMLKLTQKMAEFDDMPNQEMRKFYENFVNQQNDKLSQEAAQNLQKGNNKQADANQEKISQNIRQARETFQNSIQANLQQKQMNNFLALARILSDILEISKEQEKIKNESFNLHPSSPKFQELARKQTQLNEALSKQIQAMSELSQKTFALTPEMGRALGKAKINMQEAIKGFSERNWSIAHNYGAEAMLFLNEAAKLLNEALGNMAQGAAGQGAGMFSFMNQMQAIAQSQLNLNNAAQQLMREGSLTPEAQAQLGRLAQQQEMIRKSIEQLNEESKAAGYSKRLTQNLESIAKEMQEIATQMRSGNITDELLQKQERIYSRLLEAQRSIYERDYEERREAKTGKEFARTSPRNLNLNDKDNLKNFNEIFFLIIREGYNKDYEEMIKKYFKLQENLKTK